MGLFETDIDQKTLFKLLFEANTGQALDEVILKYPEVFKVENWSPLGGNPSNFGVIENQQSKPIAALIEKITHSIDALLTKKCLQAGIDPASAAAPKSMEAAIEAFYPDEYKNKSWDLTSFRKKQAEEIQILADGPGVNTSLTIYDSGEGQHPAEFESTFLSLFRGNKNEIQFDKHKSRSKFN